MSILQAISLGVVQGVAEFLPISSSAHLALIPQVLGWPYQGLAYDVALHWGTLLALILCFGRYWRGLILAGLKRDGSHESRLFWNIALATLPGVAAGLALEHHVETIFHEPKRMAATLIAFGLLLWLADWKSARSKGREGLDLKTCFLIGLAQALAIIPGVSRSGITITAGLMLGLKREEAAQFSFLLAVPIVFGAGVKELPKVGAAAATAPFWLGIMASAVSGYLAIKFLLAYVRSKNLNVFVVYRLSLGALLLYLL